jgi:hypothetical protein
LRNPRIESGDLSDELVESSLQLADALLDLRDPALELEEMFALLAGPPDDYGEGYEETNQEKRREGHVAPAGKF